MRARGQAVGAIVALGLGCAGGAEVVERPGPALARPAPAPPDLAIDPAGTHCADGEVAWFSCAVEGGSTLSLCSTWPFSADAGALYYRYGPAGAVELEHPGSPEPFSRAFTYRSEETQGGMGRPPPSTTSELSFEREGARYTLRTVLMADLQAAILVTPRGGDPVELPCVDGLRGEVSALEGPVGYAPPL